MQVTVLARMVDIEAVVCVFDGAHPPTAAGELTHQIDAAISVVDLRKPEDLARLAKEA